jgi:light-regulated signal transduction histidine kinase (bacteriophytochrome)
LLNHVTTNTQRMGQIIEDLLRFSRLGRQWLSKQRVQTAALVRDVLEELRNEPGDRTIDVRVGDLPDCVGDPSLLKQVFVNLLSNAFKYTRQQKAAAVEVGYQPQAGEGVYFVRDNGVGFDMDYAGKLFGVFQRLHRADEFEGTGVGLSIVQRILQRHGGRIWVHAAVNSGATFFFTIPGGTAEGNALQDQSARAGDSAASDAGTAKSPSASASYHVIKRLAS